MTIRDWRWIILGLIAGGITSALIGEWQYVTGTSLSVVQGTSIHRIRALYGSPDNLGLLFDRIIPIALGIALFANLIRFHRMLWWGAVLLMSLALLLTNSRGAWIGVSLGCLLILCFGFPWGKLALGTFIVFVCVGFAFARPHFEHAFRSTQTDTTQSRINIWRSAVTMIRAHPLFGVGPDNFLHYYAPPAYRIPTIRSALLGSAICNHLQALNRAPPTHTTRYLTRG